MSEKLCKRRITPHASRTIHAPLTLSEILDGLENIADILSYNPWPGDFEIIAIYPNQTRESCIIMAPAAKQSAQRGRPSAKILSLKTHKRRCRSA